MEAQNQCPMQTCSMSKYNMGKRGRAWLAQNANIPKMHPGQKDGPLHGLSNAATGAAPDRTNASRIIHVSFQNRCRATGAPYDASTSAAL
eukprot:355440-Chlamydomonas_euryale.AAC.2